VCAARCKRRSERSNLHAELDLTGGTLVGPFLSLNLSGSNSGDFSQPIDRLTAAIFQDLAGGKLVSELNFTEVSPPILRTFAFHDVLFADTAVSRHQMAKKT
jgi:hypothetical protein